MFGEYFDLTVPDGKEKRYFPAAVKYTLTWDKFLINKFRPLSTGLDININYSKDINALRIKPLRDIKLFLNF